MAKLITAGGRVCDAQESDSIKSIKHAARRLKQGKVRGVVS